MWMGKGGCCRVVVLVYEWGFWLVVNYIDVGIVRFSIQYIG